MNNTVFVGIDCGLDGAVAAIWPHGDVQFFDTPTLHIGKGKTNKREYDSFEMGLILRRIDERRLDECHPMGGMLVAIERQQAMPFSLHGRGQGVVSSMKTGYGFGLWVGICVGLRAPFELVAPVSWKRKLMADMPKEKSASLLVAKRLFPQAAEELKLKNHHGRSDALLIAEFARRRSGHVPATSPKGE